ncbi:hypothetical protein [Microbacterium sp. A84]|uniref:hypothetical protein n=1 Tax=Microbacterium sp. A84 TaxID=3450715 RepID=UPI003F425031
MATKTNTTTKSTTTKSTTTKSTTTERTAAEKALLADIAARWADEVRRVASHAKHAKGLPIEVDDVVSRFWDAVAEAVVGRDDLPDAYLGAIARNITADATEDAFGQSRRTYNRIQDARFEMQEMARLEGKAAFEPTALELHTWMELNWSGNGLAPAPFVKPVVSDETTAWVSERISRIAPLAQPARGIAARNTDTRVVGLELIETSGTRVDGAHTSEALADEALVTTDENPYDSALREAMETVEVEAVNAAGERVIKCFRYDVARGSFEAEAMVAAQEPGASDELIAAVAEIQVHRGHLVELLKISNSRPVSFLNRELAAMLGTTESKVRRQLTELRKLAREAVLAV